MILIKEAILDVGYLTMLFYSLSHRFDYVFNGTLSTILSLMILVPFFKITDFSIIIPKM